MSQITEARRTAEIAAGGKLLAPIPSRECCAETVAAQIGAGVLMSLGSRRFTALTQTLWLCSECGFATADSKTLDGADSCPACLGDVMRDEETIGLMVTIGRGENTRLIVRLAANDTYQLDLVTVDRLGRMIVRRTRTEVYCDGLGEVIIAMVEGRL